MSTTTLTAAGAPTSVGCTVGDAQLSLAWVAPTDNGGYTISGYAYSTDGGTTYTTIPNSQVTSPYVISGLTNGTAYSVTIRAITAFGDGATSRIVSSTPSASVTPAAPGVPTNVSSFPDSGIIGLVFTEGADNGSTITNYTYSLDGGSTYTALSPAQYASPITISGLTNYTKYTVNIKAVSIVGDSTATASFTEIPCVETLSVTKQDVREMTTAGSHTVLDAGTNAAYVSTNMKYIQVGWYAYLKDSAERIGTVTKNDGYRTITIDSLIKNRYSTTVGGFSGAQYAYYFFAKPSISITPYSTTSNITGTSATFAGFATTNQTTGSFSFSASPTWMSTIQVGWVCCKSSTARVQGIVTSINTSTNTITLDRAGLTGGSTFYFMDDTNVTIYRPAIAGLLNSYSSSIRASIATGDYDKIGLGYNVYNTTDLSTSIGTVNYIDSSGYIILATGSFTSGKTCVFVHPNYTISGVFTSTGTTSSNVAVYTAGNFTSSPGLGDVSIGWKMLLAVADTYDIYSTVRSNNYPTANTITVQDSVLIVNKSTLYASHASTPGAPTALVATSGDTTVSVAFTAPTVYGSSGIMEYQYSTDGGSTYTSVSQTTSPISISGLTNGTTYTILIKAVDSVGAGTASSSVSATPAVPATAAGAPTALVATAGNGQISVAFDAPTDNGGATVTGYKYSLNGGDFVTASQTSSPVIVDNLTNGTEYTIIIKAVNSAGDGTASGSVSATPFTVAGAPTALVATAGNTQISVAFTVPADNGGSVITGYKYSLNSGAFVSVAQTASPIVVSGLTNGTSYSIVIKAVNAAGDGAVSTSVSATPITVAGAPTALVATAGNAQLSVAFDAPTDTGGSTITGYKYSMDGGTFVTATQTASPIVVSGLTNGTSYSIIIKAVNAAGDGAVSTSVSATPITVAGAPTALVATAGNAQISVAFVAPTNTGGSTITGYKYSVDGGAFVTATQTASPIVVSGLTNGTSYSITLKAVNAAGDGTESTSVSATPFTVAGAPAALVATAGNAQISVAFDAPTDTGGAAVSGYKYALNGGTYVTATETTSPIVITGLTNGTTYSITLKAVNAAGDGAESASASATPITTAGAPTALAATAVNTQISVSFTAPTDTGGATITGYKYAVDGGAYVTATETASPIVVGGLTNGTSYSIVIKAVNAAGDGAESASVSATPLTTAGAPTSLVATSGNTEISVAFDAPVDNGGATVSGYKYSLNSGEYITATQTSSPIVVSGLTNGTLYSITIKAVNAAGDGAVSDSVSDTPATVAGAPTALVATAGNTQLSIAFDAPADNGGATITGYKYSVDGGVYQTATETSSPIVVSGLTNGTSYSITIKAVNAAGDGAESASVSATPITVAGAPTVLVATAGNAQISVAFDAPTDNGGATITSYKYALNGGVYQTATETSSPIVVSGLTNGTLYSITIKAVNAAGDGAESASVSATPLAVAGAPTALVATAGNTQLSIAFDAPADNGGATITGYKFSVDGGAFFLAAETSSPIVISELTNGTSYSIIIKAVNSVGDGAESASVSATPSTVASAPSALVATAGNSQISLAFDAPTDNGGATITGYKYSLNGGAYFLATETASPIVIVELANGTSYSITIKAVNAAGDGAESASVSATPLTTAGAPSALVATAGNTQISVAFDTPTDTGGADITGYKYALDGGIYQTATETSSPIIVTGLTNGTTYSIVIKAVNSVGDGAESASVSATPSTVAGAPTALVATAGDTQISVAFDAPTDNGGAAITGYKYALDGGAFVSASQTTSPIIVSGLTNGTLYNITIKAVNAAGDGTESASVSATPAAAVTISDAPTDLVATAGNAQISVAFTAPIDNGGAAVSGYKYAVDGGAYVIAAESSSPVVITGLTNGTSYSITLKSVNSAGDSAESASVSATPITVAGAPSALVATAGNAQISVAFDAPVVTGGTDVTGYKYALNGGAFVSATQTSSPIVIADLTNGTSYSIVIKAVNAAGDGAESASVSATPLTTAGAPTTLVATAGNAQISVAFDAPTDTGGATITGYKYALDGGIYQTATETSSPITISGLTNGTPYSIVIKAVNAAGDGAESASVSATPSTVAGAPTALVATAGDTQISVAFTAPADTGGATIASYKYALDGGAFVTATQTSSPIVIAELTNGTSYSIVIKAVNAAGDGAESASVSATPLTVAGAPSALVATAGNAQISVAFDAPADTGGAAVSGYKYSVNSGAFVSVGQTSSPIVIAELTNGTPYSIVIKAVNAAGDGAESASVSATPITVSGAPSAPVATAGNAQISVAFDAPTDTGGADITGYKYSVNGGVFVSATQTSSPIVVAGLTNGTSYSITIKAVNAAGDGAESASVSATPITTAGAPSALVATAGNTQISVAFDAPTDIGGATVSGYKYALNGGAYATATETSSPIVITGLTNGTSYSITIKAVNAAGDGTESASVSATPSTVAGAPSALVATAGNTQISVAFTAPADNGGAAVSGYKYALDGGVFVSATETSSPIVVSGLTNGTSYSIVIKAVNAAGDGAESAGVSATPITVAGAPTALVATASNTQISVAFTAPADTGGATVSGYKYALNGGAYATATETSSPIVVSGLTNGTSYSITIKAVNAAGDGTESASVSATPLTTAGAPTALVATTGNTQISVAFDAPTDNGGAAVSGYKYALDGGAFVSATQTSSPIVVTGLTNGTSYSITIKAVTSVGDGAESASVSATPATVAGAPTALVATASNAQISISFTAPASTGGAAVSGYKYALNGGTYVTATETTSPIVITGLANGTTYSITLKAVNAAGDGTASSSVSATPAEFAPGAPTSMVAVPGSSKATVVFVADATAANYMYSLNGGAYIAFSPTQSSSPVVISGLTNGTAYTINLKGTNAAGDGDAAAAVVSVTPGAAPGAPSTLVATTSDSKVQIAFVAGTTNGYAITSHQYSLDGGSTYTSFSPAQATSPVSITGLTNGTTYSIRLKSINQLGISAASSAISVTPAGVSGVPSALSVVATSTTAATLSFTAGTSAGGTVTNYLVSTDGGANFDAVSTTNTASPISITGLTSGATYSIKIKEVTTGGTSAASAAAALTLTAPDAVTGLTATTESSQTSVAFTSTAPSGAAITNYAYSINGGSSYASFSPAQTASPVTITGLTDGVSYTIMLQAVNALGTSAAGDSVVVTPAAPTITPSIVAVDNAATVTLATTYAGETVVKYWYSIDYGVNWIDPTNEIIIENLTNGVEYSMWYYAVTFTGTSPIYVASIAPVQGAPGAPTIVAITPSTDGTTLSVEFTAPTYTGTTAITNYTYTTNNGALYTEFNPTQTTSPLTISGTVLEATYKVAIAAINDSGVGDTSTVVTVLTFVPCFATGTKILTNKGYKRIETLRPGDMVETLRDKFVPIHTIGRRAVIPPRDKTQRSPNHLFRCSPNAYPEIFEDLVMTGYHARLQPTISPALRAKVCALCKGQAFVTDGMYRVPICLDDRADVFIPDMDETADAGFDIYNFALDAKNRYMNYGVYANGLLVESTSIRYMTELSQMEFLV